MTRMFSRGAFCFATAMFIAGIAHAQEFPSKPIRLVVPYGAGGPTDALARLLGDGLQKRLKQPVLVENKPGGGSILGVDSVAKSKGDGYTLLFATGAPFVISPALNPKLPYRTADFEPVAIVASYTMVLVTGKNQPFDNLQGFLAYAKDHPGKLTYGSSGAGMSNHLASELMAHATGLQLIHIPYRGNAPAMTDVIAGTITFMFDMPATTMQHVHNGKVKVLGSTGSTRNPLVADIPTLQESGVPSYDVTSWSGLFAPAGTPGSVVRQLNQASNEFMADPEVSAKLRRDGYEFKAETPEQLQKRIETEFAVWSQLIQKAGIKVD